jgi:hypothetical protein
VNSIDLTLVMTSRTIENMELQRLLVYDIKN